jgi:hypothetical protein
MNIDLYELFQLSLSVANALVLVAAIVAIFWVHRVLCGKAIHSRLAAGTAIEAEIAALTANGRRVASQLQEMQKTIDSLAILERLLEEPASRGLPMERATTLARSGATVDELTRSCGLSIGEARLMRRLHSGNLTARPAIRS